MGTYKGVEASGRARSERALLNFEKENKKCQQCGKLLTFEQRRNKFCSHSCSASSTNLGRASSLSKDNKCKSCGVKISNQRTYCDGCIDKGLHTRAVKSIAEAKTPQSRRRYLVKKRGSQCEECGLSEWRGVKLSVQMHHIDGNPDNNLETNLILLCPNCHSITPNYGVKNTTSKDTERNRKRRNLYHTGHFKEK